MCINVNNSIIKCRNKDIVTMKPINEIIKDYFRDNGLKQNVIAANIGINSDSSFSQMLKNNNLNSDLIHKISVECQYDFFAEMSRELRKENKNIKSIAKKDNDSSAFEDVVVDIIKKRFPNVLR